MFCGLCLLACEVALCRPAANGRTARTATQQGGGAAWRVGAPEAEHWSLEPWSLVLPPGHLILPRAGSAAEPLQGQGEERAEQSVRSEM